MDPVRLRLPSRRPSSRFRSPVSENAAQLLQRRKGNIALPEVPGLDEVRLPRSAPAEMPPLGGSLSVGLVDPVLEAAREAKAFDDFKILADARPRPLTSEARIALEREAEAAAQAMRMRISSPYQQDLASQQIFLRTFIEGAYELKPELEEVKGFVPPKWRIESGNPTLDAAFFYAEKTWSRLVRSTPAATGSSLLPSRYPIVVAAGRFKEIYYWDTYFGVKGLLALRRLELAQMQVENLLEFVRQFGFVPNGGRDYYLSRSQPPFLSSLVREVYEASVLDAQEKGTPGELERLRQWLDRRAYPLLMHDYYEFWMNPTSRYDRATGLNKHWDELDLPRPERHAADQEERLGKTFRDVRAAAESGLDFTDAFEGEASQVAGVLLNSMLYKTEKDLEWLCRHSGRGLQAWRLKQAARERRRAIYRHLWNEEAGRFENFNLRTGSRIEVLTADTFAPLFAGLATRNQAARVRAQLEHLELSGGIMASELRESTHQWDGTNGWAPHQVFAIQGLLNYSVKGSPFEKDARRLAKKWVGVIARIYDERGSIYERVDVERMGVPHVDGTKYPVQEGFLWTNGSFVWAALEVLGYPLHPMGLPVRRTRSSEEIPAFSGIGI